MTTTSDERRAALSTANFVLMREESNHNERKLATAVVRLVEEVGKLEVLLNQRLEQNAENWARIARAHQRIEALRAGLETIAFGDCPRTAMPVKAQNTLETDDKEATK